MTCNRCSLVLRRSFLPSLWLFGLLVTALFGASTLADRMVPIRGEVSGTVTATPIEGSPMHFRLENLGNGNCSHLGHIEAIWALPDVELDLQAGTVTVSELEWEGVLRAANGDEIFGRYAFPEGTIPFSKTGEIVFEAELEVTGGTGRFANAHGHAMSFGFANIFTQRFEIELEGEISPPGNGH